MGLNGMSGKGSRGGASGDAFTQQVHLQRIAQAVIGFARRNHRLPCPDTDGDALEDCGTAGVLGGLPFLTPRGPLVDAVSAAIRDVTGLDTELSTTGGTSDGRFIAQICPQVVELGPPNDCRFINESQQPCVYLVVRLNQSGFLAV